MNMHTTLKQLFQQHRGKVSDQWSLYLDEWEGLFGPYRDQPIHLLEIGIQNGGSLEIWGQWFSKAERIIGCDIDKKCENLRYDDSRISVVVGDANSDDCERKILELASTFDVIIDDGSHKSSDIVRSFARYFPHLLDGGIYIVEDLHTSYWAGYEGGLHNPLASMAFFKRIADLVNFEHWRNNKTRQSLLTKFVTEFDIDINEFDLTRIHSVEFVNSLCIIRKLAPDKNVLGKRIVVGLDQSITEGWEKFNGTAIQDLSIEVKDDGDLDVFALIQSVSALTTQMGEKEQTVHALSEQVADCDGQILALSEQVSEKEQIVQALSEQVEDRDGQIQALSEQVGEKDQTVQVLAEQMHEKDVQLHSASQKVNEILVSKTWRVSLLIWNVRLKVLPPGSQRLLVVRTILNAIYMQISNSRRTRRLNADARLIRGSGMFSVEWYLITNPDVAQAKEDPLLHYLQFGGTEGRDPGLDFSGAWYLDAYPDVKNAGVNPLVHYLRIGRQEGRVIQTVRTKEDLDLIRSSGLFNVEWYLTTNPDVAQAKVDPLLHYLQLGGTEGRDPGPDFSGAWYVEAYSDVKNAGINPLVHYLRIGRQEERVIQTVRTKEDLDLISSSGLFNVEWYLTTNPDVAQAKVDPLLHYLQLGGSEGRDPSLDFSSRWYLRMYSDVQAAGFNPLVHYLKHGREEGRLAIKSAGYLPPPGRILVMDWRLPMADVSAGERGTVGILRDLCTLGFDVVFLPTDMQTSPEYAETLGKYGISVIDRSQGYASSIDYLHHHGDSFATFYLMRVNVAEEVLDTIRLVAPHAKILFHLPDVSFLREDREAELRNDPVVRARAEATRERELAMIRQVDRTVIVSPAELLVLRPLVLDSPISIFPALYSRVEPFPSPFEARQDIYFLGGYEHTPNIDAIHWFVEQIWPLVREKLPAAFFHIVGSKAPQDVRDLALVPGVLFDGFVKDLDAFVSSKRVSIAPIRFGAGIKGKVTMALGAGIGCVCTSVAIEGLHIEDGIHALVADEPGAFANAVVRLYTDKELWAQLSSNGRELVRRHFGEEANRATLLAVLNDSGALPLPLFLDYCKNLSPQPAPCPAEGEPVDVSVIIPVYNQWEYTRTCLNSILEVSAAGEISYEIILADDGSVDGTVLAAEQYPGLRVVRTPTNVGFLRNCNHAAKHARGKYILLLNNDTVVLPDWLSALYRVMEADESAAIVGSKMLYPDGTIQEAGAVLWSDATANNLGRGEALRKAVECSYAREVDYVSAASILVRKAFWDRVGGFDELYETAYCEDCDLAMAARALGMRVLYEPASEIVHFESRSYVDQAPVQNPALQLRNTEKLLKKWKQTFDQQHRPRGTSFYLGVSNAQRSPSPSAVIRRNRGKLNVLYFTPFPSHPGNHGNQTCIRDFGKLFQSMGHKVHFVLLQSNLFTGKDAEHMRALWDTLDILPNKVPMVADGKPIPFDGWYQEGLGEQIAYLCAKYDIDVVFCSYIFQSKLLDFVPTHTLRVIHTHDKMGNRYDMLRESGLPLEFFSCTPEEEGAYLRRADLVVAMREQEARYFDGVTGKATAIVIPHLTPAHFVKRKFLQVRDVGMVASSNITNLSAVQAFLEAIDRRLRGAAPPFTIHVAGQVKDMIDRLPPEDAKLFRKPWVRMHGFVPNIEQFYDQMDLIVSPVTMGTGMNIKTVEALAFGMPLLSTAWGSKGIQTTEPMHSYANLDSLTDGLLLLAEHPNELQRLAGVSRSVYGAFFDSGLAAMKGMFNHPKLKRQLNEGTSLAAFQRQSPDTPAHDLK